MATRKIFPVQESGKGSDYVNGLNRKRSWVSCRVKAPCQDMNDVTEMLASVAGFSVLLDVLSQGGSIVSLSSDPICKTSSANVGAISPFEDFVYYFFHLMWFQATYVWAGIYFPVQFPVYQSVPCGALSDLVFFLPIFQESVILQIIKDGGCP